MSSSLIGYTKRGLDMSDFLSFLQNMERERDRAAQESDVESPIENDRAEPVSHDAQRMAEDAYARFAGKSEQELMKELENEIARRKSEGGISQSEIEGFASMILPFLGVQQQTRLKELLKLLK